MKRIVTWTSRAATSWTDPAGSVLDRRCAVVRGLKTCVVAAALAAALPGAACADGGLLDVEETEAEAAQRRADFVGAFRTVEPAKLPVAVRRAADGVVPGLRVV